MSLQRNSSTAGETPLAGARRRLSAPAPRGILRTLRQSLAAFVTRDIVLDIAERGAVLLRFVLFVNRLLSRFVQLVVLQIAHRELVIAAATINAQALLLFVSETLAVVLILMRRRTPIVSSHPVRLGALFRGREPAAAGAARAGRHPHPG